MYCSTLVPKRKTCNRNRDQHEHWQRRRLNCIEEGTTHIDKNRAVRHGADLIALSNIDWRKQSWSAGGEHSTHTTSTAALKPRLHAVCCWAASSGASERQASGGASG